MNEAQIHSRDITLSARVSSIELAEFALWLKSEGVTHMNKSSIVGDALTVMVNALSKNGLHRTTITTRQEAQEVLQKLGIKVSVIKKQARTLSPEIIQADVKETIPMLTVESL